MRAVPGGLQFISWGDPHDRLSVFRDENRLAALSHCEHLQEILVRLAREEIDRNRTGRTRSRAPCLMP